MWLTDFYQAKSMTVIFYMAVYAILSLRNYNVRKGARIAVGSVQKLAHILQ